MIDVSELQGLGLAYIIANSRATETGATPTPIISPWVPDPKCVWFLLCRYDSGQRQMIVVRRRGVELSQPSVRADLQLTFAVG